MVDRENREDWRRERSLLARGQSVRGDEASAAPNSSTEKTRPSWQEDAATRHRLARSRREAKPNPLLSALAGGEQNPEIELPQSDPSGRSSRLSGWLGSRLSEDEATKPEPRVTTGTAGDREPARVYASGRYGDSVPGNATQSVSGDESDQEWKPLIDPMKVVGGVLRSKLLIATTALIGLALGVAIAISTPKKYEAATDLIVDPSDLKLTDRDLTQSIVASDATLASVENRMRILTSGAVLNKVVDKLNLVNDPEFNGQGSGGLGVMSLIRSVLSRNDGPAGVDEGRRRALTIGNLAEAISVERSGKTFVITVAATTQSGEKSALIANTMTDVFLQTYGQIQSNTAGRATDELTARLDELRKGVEVAERKVEDFRASHDLVDAQGHLISDDELLKLNEQLTITRARTLELNARAASARAVNVDSVLGGTLPEEINSNTMSELRSQYAALKQEADRSGVRLGPRHPERLALDAQLAGARERIGMELRRIVSSLQVDLKRSVQLEQELSSRLAQLKVRSGDVNNDLVSMRELEREANAKRAVYESYLLRAKETGEQKDINTANINVISKAYPPLEANGPSRAVVAVAGLLLGLASGIGLGAMRGAYESLRDTADARSRRRKLDDRQQPFEDKSRRRSAESIPPVANVPAEERAGPVGAMLSAVRSAIGRKAPAEKGPLVSSRQPVPPAAAQPATPRQESIYPGYPEQTPSFAPQHPAPAGYPDPQFQQGVYAPQAYPQYPQQAFNQPPQQAYPQQPPMPAQTMPQPQAYAPPPMHQPQGYAQPYPYPQQPMAYPPQAQPWQMQPQIPVAAYPYPQPAAPYAGPIAPQYQPHAAPVQQAFQPQSAPAGREAAASAEETAPIEEIRASLREFRDAVRDLTESRSRRRYF